MRLVAPDGLRRMVTPSTSSPGAQMTYQPTPHLLIEAKGPVTVLTLNNPDMLNAFLDDMHVAMREVWRMLSVDQSVRAVVLTGAGRAFSAGGDIPGFIRNYEDPEHRRESLRGAR